MDTATINQVLATFLPALGPYGPVISLAITALEKVAPVVYHEILMLIQQIQSGDTVSDTDVARLNTLIGNLKNPGEYFA